MYLGVESRDGSEMNSIKSNNFSRTCNRFSQFLKERRSLGDIEFGSIGSPFSSSTPRSGNMKVIGENKSLELFPLSSSSFGSFNGSTGNIPHRRTSQKPKEDELKNTMTIIYDGKVLVFDDLQENMAKEIMLLASRGVLSSTPRHETYGCENTITSHFTHGLSNLPYKRGASLHRFMEKRKHRMAAKAPYKINNSSSTKQQEEHQLELKL